jgi:hypothetical protein
MQVGPSAAMKEIVFLSTLEMENFLTSQESAD